MTFSFLRSLRGSGQGNLPSILFLLTEYSFSIFPFSNSLGHHVRIKYEGENIACVSGDHGKLLRYEKALIKSITQERKRILN